ncbi:MAG: ferredoxin [Desulfobacteraceae bacterium]|jgi:ferredoxin
MKTPVVDLSECTMCGICTEICPSVFKVNRAGYIEVLECDVYPENEVLDAVKNCPAQCIMFQD